MIKTLIVCSNKHNGWKSVFVENGQIGWSEANADLVTMHPERKIEAIHHIEGNITIL